jgi:CHAD domain-containing protein
MSTAEVLETEQKYDAEASAELPALLEIPGVERVAEPLKEQLEAVYFDTRSLALTGRRITLCRRTGGADHGWHIKFPRGGHQWEELRAPLGQEEVLPEEFADHLDVYTRGEALVPIAQLSTQRAIYRLYGHGGEHLTDFTDDLVRAETIAPPGPGMKWREWEIKLVHGSPLLLMAAEGVLAASGANRSRSVSKLARAMGEAWPDKRFPGLPVPRKKGPAVDVVTAYLDGQMTELLACDPGVRLGMPDAVHRMRSATRRIRSALATYRTLFDKAAVSRLRHELQWFAGILSRPGDAEVMRERLRQHVRELPNGLSRGPVSKPIELELGTAYNTGYRRVLKSLESGRYYGLLTELEAFRDRPPVEPRGSKPALKTTTKLVNRTAKRLDRAHDAVLGAEDGPSRDAALHQVRKDAKRLRHAAESVAGLKGKRARKILKAARRQQKILGDHQDSVMARALLNRLAADPDMSARTAAVYHRIGSVEDELARAAEAEYVKLRKKVYGIRLRR